MSDFRLDAKGFKELKAAVQRNPQKAKSEIAEFISRGITAYNRIILRSPWRVGQSGGGAPVDTRNLLDQHQRETHPTEGRIFVNTSKVKYAEAVHEGSGPYTIKNAYGRGISVRHPGLKARPWLDYAQRKARGDIEKLQDTMLNNIVSDLAR